MCLPTDEMNGVVETMRRWFFLYFALLATPAFGAAPAIDEPLATRFTHTAWTQKDGVPSGINAMCQSRDGWLWFGTTSGLYRFDGKTFERRDPFPSGDVSSRSIVALYAAPSGDVWMAFASGRVAVLRGGGDAAAEIVPIPEGHSIDTLLEDGDGRVMAFDNSAIFLLQGGRFVPIDASWQFDGADITDATTDADGNIWVDTTKHLLELKRRAVRFDIDSHSDLAGGSLGVADDGRMWINADKTGFEYYPGSVAQRLPSTSRNEGIRLIDRSGAYWRAACPTGVCRVSDPMAFKGSSDALGEAIMASRFERGLSATAAKGILEDRDGNIWLVTSGGIDRFRPNLAVQVTIPDAPAYFTLVSDKHGDVWTGTSSESALRNFWWHLVGGHAERVGDFRGNISAAFADRDGSIVLSGIDGTWRFEHGAFTAIASPTGPFVGRTLSIARDADDALWFTSRGQMINRLQGDRWTAGGELQSLRKTPPSILSTDAAGHLLMGYRENAFSIVEHGTVRSFGEQDGLQTGTVNAILPGQPMIVGGERGLAALVGSRFRSLQFDEPDAVRGISGMVRTPDDALWLNGSAGAVRVEGRDLRQALADPDFIIPVRVYDQAIGLPGAAQVSPGFPTLVQGGDGRLWFAAVGGLAWLDPLHLPINRTPPTVHITAVIADGADVMQKGTLHVSRNTHALRFVFSAIVLADADRAKFRYRLSGVDPQWQNGGNRREADYSNLSPGDYVFQVIASNEDGVWNTRGASVAIHIPPAVYQTKIFIGSALAMVLLLMFLAYRHHIDRVRRSLVRQVVERHAERERIARELHDTIFQDMQALVLVMRATRPEASGPAQGSIDRAIGHAEIALTRGRERIEQLRALGEPTVDIRDVLHELISQLPEGCKIPVDLSCQGHPWPVKTRMADELRWMTREALINASVHSGATAVHVQLHFSWRHLKLVIADNGSGIDAAVLASGSKPGRWGMLGMRERAASIGAKLLLQSTQANGTRIVVTVSRGRRMPPGV